MDWRALIGTARRSHVVRNIGATVASRGILIGIGLVSSVLIARALGPEGRGIFGVATVVAALGAQLGNAGLHSSNTYFVARDRGLLPTLLGNSLLVGLGLASVVSAIVGAALFLHPAVTPLHDWMLVLAVIAIPLGISYLLLQNLLIGIDRIRAYNVIELALRSAGLVLTALAIAVGFSSAEVFFAIAVLATGLGTLATAAVLRRAAGRPTTLSLALIAEHLPYGLRAYLASLLAFLLLRVDLLLVQSIRGPTDAGYYAVAASMADLLYVVPAVAMSIAFPRLAALDLVSDKVALAKRMSTSLALVTAALVVCSWIVADPVVRLLYGDSFAPSIPAFMILAIAMWFYGVNGILSSLLAAVGFPSFAIWIWGAALSLNVGLNLLMVPTLGIVGAGWASAAAYLLVLAAQFGYVRSRLSVPNAS
jgi:O-antigen/teichoic acid export membrane protein